MRSRIQDYVPDLNTSHLRLGGYNKYVSNQVDRIVNRGIEDSAPERIKVRGITIDSAISLDLDDGVWVERTDNGGYCVWIHISDVSEFVPIFSPLDLEALRRATSIYRRTIHNMFPPELANGTFSLDPSGGDKLTCTLQIDINSHGDITNHRFFESQFTNLRRYDYELFGADYANRDSEYFPTLHLLNEISVKLRLRRRSQGGISHFGDDGRGLTLDGPHKQKEGSYPATKCHTIIRTLMLMTNMIVGNHLAIQPGAQCVYRRHDDNEKYGFYYHKPCKHAGLRIQNYAQFTSPIRRFPDLVIHRILKALFRGGDSPYTLEDIRCMAEHANNVQFLVKTYGSPIEQEGRGDEHIKKAKTRLGRPPLLSDLKTYIKVNVSRSNKLPRAIFQAIADNINNQPLDTWIWAIGVILLSQETELKKLLKDKILNHVGVRIRGFLNVLGQTRVTLGEDPIFVVEEKEQAGKYSIQIFCRKALISQNSCTIGGKNENRDFPHQCRREAVEKLFDFFIDAA